MKKTLTMLGVVATCLGLLAAPTMAAPSGNNGHGTPNAGEAFTTLDACGYFFGYQTSNNIKETTIAGAVYTIERGTWTGVWNNYNNPKVGSLGNVQGSYVETTTVDANGNTTGTESFNSNRGQIDQSFSYGPDVAGGYAVQVTATGDLAFLSSNTDGECYSGTFPRA